MTRTHPEVTASAVRLHELLRIIAHDVRSPLHTITMATDLLDARSPAGSDVRRPIDIIRAAVRQIDRLVEDVLVSGAYVVPLYHQPTRWVARWSHIRRPDTTPVYGPQYQTWWSAR